MDFLTSKTLNNGVKIPLLGLGVFQSGADTKQAVLWALEAGYRHIDTAKAYFNEDAVGQAIKESGVDRKDIFITTKLANDDQRGHVQRENIEKSLEYLQTDYIDLLLIHWPVAGIYKETWKIFEEFYNQGKIRAIGVSNFQIHHLDDLLADAQVVPVVNQVECHPYFPQKELFDYCEKKGIAMQAWSPLGGNIAGTILGDPVIQEIAGRYGKSPAQLVIRWHLQRDTVVIPKSVHKDRIFANGDVFDFEISEADMAAITALDKGHRFGADPDNFNF